MQKPIIIIVVNVIVVAFFVYFGLGPSQLWKRVISSNGEISWLWFGFNIVLIDLLLLLVVTSISINLPSDSGKNTTLGDLEKPTFYVQLSDNLYDDTEMNKAGQIIYDGLITLPITEKTFLTDVFLEISFPAIIEKFETVKEVGVEGA
ncbi:MAG: hypothetical protein ACE5G1_10890, partial [bacterium]